MEDHQPRDTPTVEEDGPVPDERVTECASRTSVGALVGLALLVIAAALLPYLATANYSFAWDDHLIIRHVDRAFQDGGLFGVLSAPFLPTPATPNNYYRPLVYLTYLVDRSVGGGHAAFAHLENVALHAMVSLLVFIFARDLLRHDVGALAAGLLFATHPIHVESVAWVAGRTDVLCALFSIASVLVWVRGVSRPPSFVRAVALGIAALLMGLACLSKEAAIVLSLVFPLAAACVPGLAAVPPRDRRRASVLTAAPAIAAVLLIRYAAVHHELGQVPLAAQLRDSYLLKEPAVAGAALLHMLRWLIVPWPHSALTTASDVVPGTLTLAAVGALVAAITWVLREDCAFGRLVTAWLVGFSLPTLLVYRSAVAAERYTYIPSIGLSLLFGFAVSRFGGIRRIAPRAVCAAVGVLTIVLGAASFARAQVWANDETLSIDLVRTSPGSSLAQEIRGNVLLHSGRVAEAVESYDRACALAPSSAPLLQTLGRARLRSGDPAGAATAFRNAIQAEPDWSEPYVGLAVACATLGDWPCVEKQRESLRFSPPALSRLDVLLGVGTR